MRALCRHMRFRRTGARTQAGELGQPLLHQVAERTVRDLRQVRLAAFRQPRLAAQRPEVHVRGQLRVEEFRQRRRFAQARVETFAAFLADDAVRVLAVRSEEHTSELPSLMRSTYAVI